MRVPLSLYIHIPWCIKKCPYCDFNSHTTNGPIPQAAYVDALIDDWEQSLPAMAGRSIESIFIGGGTPSLLDAEHFDRLLQHIAQSAPLADALEITLEANPGTFELERFSAYRALGINRLSLGVQSLQNEKLQALGRIHSAEEAWDTLNAIGDTGFENINVDIMHGLPNQSVADALQDLDRVISMAPTHLSWYELTIEPNTQFWHRPPSLPHEDNLHAVQIAGQERLLQAGFRQYEISAYSRTGYRCRHNDNYWSFGDFIGIGAGAHGKITDLNTGQIKRVWKTRQPTNYMAQQKPFIAGEKTLTDAELPIEFMLNALRLCNGFPLAWFNERTGRSKALLATGIEKALSQGLLVYHAERLQPTPQGLRYLNNLLECFMP